MGKLGWWFWDPSREIVVLPVLHFPILWYSLFFALGFLVSARLFLRLFQNYLSLQFPEWLDDHSSQVRGLVDRLFIYVACATLIGARLGHVFFYEVPSFYLRHPWKIFSVWEGGLASHGAVIAILGALFFFRRHLLERHSLPLSFFSLLDLVVVPTSFAAVCIRIGNFFNQEIVGYPTRVPWAVIFGHPAGGGLVAPRHPVQLYEALFYLFVGIILWILVRRFRFLSVAGRTAALFFLLVFSFRFVVEFWKVEQSLLLNPSSFLSMGQWLSLPMVGFGAWLLLFRRSRKKSSTHYCED